MKKYKNIYLIVGSVGSVVIALGLITFSLFATRCHGDECKVEKNAAREEQTIFKMDPVIIEKQLKNNEIVLLDVREDSEWEAGHIRGAYHIALGNLNTETVKDMPKNIPIYIYCRSGKRAGEAEIKLKELGFSNAKRLGGIIEWQENGGSLVVE